MPAVLLCMFRTLHKCGSSRMAGGPSLRFSSIGPDQPNACRGVRTESLAHPHSAPLARETMVTGHYPVITLSTMAAAARQGPAIPSEQRHFSASPRASGFLGLARKRLNMAAAGLSCNHSECQSILHKDVV